MLDSKPIFEEGMEIFLSSSHLFGFSEQASSTELKTTMEAYRLCNLYVFEYGFDETIALHGRVPPVIGYGDLCGCF